MRTLWIEQHCDSLPHSGLHYITTMGRFVHHYPSPAVGDWGLVPHVRYMAAPAGCPPGVSDYAPVVACVGA